MITVRRAGILDARQMAELLNAIIEKGGTTAYTRSVSQDMLVAKMQTNPARSAWHVAEDDAGDILGFQFLIPSQNLPPEAGDIASFVRVGRSGLGVGSKLFEATKAAATSLGYLWINATIRADNSGGLAYYQSRGFETYALHPDQKLDNGLLVDKVSTRYNLT